MLYVSTRGTRLEVNSAQAIARGLSREGGLFMPAFLPKMYLMELIALSEMDYIDRAEYILSKFLTSQGGWGRDEVLGCARGAYGSGFSRPEVAPVRPLGERSDVLELFHGPTCAFKDFALQIMPRLLTAAAKKVYRSEKEMLILVATSGDTGKAALEGFQDVEGTKILVFYPEDGVSAVQKWQMITQEGSNVRVVAVRGNFDDAQSGVKAMFSDRNVQLLTTARNQELTSANSINWGRLVPQVVYYFSAYCDLINQSRLNPGEQVNFVVPTGNFGNILAGYIAKQMGLPVKKLICASNRNRVLTDFFETGLYDRKRPFFTTSSPSMDILVSSNLERLLYLASGQDCAAVTDWMRQLSRSGAYQVPKSLQQALLKEFAAGSCDEEQCDEAIRSAWQQRGYLADPHTAVALHVLEEYRVMTGDSTRSVVVSTASPYKFAGSVLRALGEPVPRDEFAALNILEQKTGIPCPAPLKDLQARHPRFSTVCNPSEMPEFISW